VGVLFVVLQFLVFLLGTDKYRSPLSRKVVLGGDRTAALL
jgi:hypothetical protein